MKIGSGWTRTQKETGKQFISVSLDAEFKELFTQFKNCNLLLSYIDPQNRSSDKSPAWTVNLVLNKEQ